MKSMLVSIVTVFYNRANYVKASIESLLNQTYENIEIIAIDDGSTDNTLEKLKLFESDSRFKVISHSNIGFVRSIKKAIKYSNGEVIAVHGSGDISLPSRIEKQVDILIKKPHIGVVGCEVKLINPLINTSQIQVPHIT